MNALAIILARAGSIGLPQKNMLPIAGKPCLHWTIEHALRSPSLDRVLLSTDGEELADLGRRAGCEVICRPDELAQNTTPIDAAARHAATAIIGHHEAIVILYGNVPVRPDDLTERALAKLRDTGCDSVQSVAPVGKHHPYWMKSLAGEDGDAIEAYHPNTIFRRQDLPPLYQLDGGIIAVTRESLFTITPGEPHAFLGKDRRAIVTEPGAVVDIDEHADLLVAEATLNWRRQQAAQPRLRNAG